MLCCAYQYNNPIVLLYMMDKYSKEDLNISQRNKNNDTSFMLLFENISCQGSSVSVIKTIINKYPKEELLCNIETKKYVYYEKLYNEYKNL
jgi:hypothetical protein